MRRRVLFGANHSRCFKIGLGCTRRLQLQDVFKSLLGLRGTSIGTPGIIVVEPADG
jgi:hypothetical protein